MSLRLPPQPFADSATAVASRARESSGPDASAPAPSTRPRSISSRRVAAPAAIGGGSKRGRAILAVMSGDLETLARKFFGAYGEGDLQTVELRDERAGRSGPG